MNVRARIVVAVLLAVPLLAIAAPRDHVCPAEEEEAFQPFLKRFAEDVKFRTSRIVFPLVVRFGDPRLGPPDVEIWGDGTVAALNYPLILSQARLKKEGLERTVTISTRYYTEVYDQRPEADSYRRAYGFRRLETCWFLESIHDSSL